MFIHLILGGASSCLWLSDISVSQVEYLRACLHTSIEFLVVSKKPIKLEPAIQTLFYAAPQISFLPASATMACGLSPSLLVASFQRRRVHVWGTYLMQAWGPLMGNERPVRR